MPGLCGLVSSRGDLAVLDVLPMLNALRFGHATHEESHQEKGLSLGCIHLGRNGQQAIYASRHAIVVAYGYITQPIMSLGVDGDQHRGIGTAAAHHIHDRYLECGEAAVGELSGAFAFSLWDRRNRTLLLASDHLGLRPVYYADHDHVLRFASEVKALLVDVDLPRRLDRAAIADFLWYGYVMGDKTYFQDIRLLPPASVLRWQDGEWTIRGYWDLRYPDRYPQRSNSWYDRLIHDALHASVRQMVRPNLRYGLSLSGGLDSRWIAIFLSKYRPDSPTFTFGTHDSDDTPIAQRVADELGLTNEFVELPATYIRDHGQAIAYLSDGMYNLFEADEFPLSTRMGEDVDVAVGGMLGDILFGHEMNPISALLGRRSVIRYWLWRTKGSRLPPRLMARVFGSDQYQELNAMALHSLEQSVSSAPSDQGFQVVHYVNIRQRQRRYINVAQLLKLAYVDIYHPIADSQVVHASLQLPPKQMMVEGAYRRSMGRFYPDMAAIPWTFVLMPPTVSMPTVLAKKAAQLTLGRGLARTPLGSHPFVRPRRYFADHTGWSRGPLRLFIEETLLSDEMEAIGVFDPRGFRVAIQDHMEGRLDLGPLLGGALALAFWARFFYLPTIPCAPVGMGNLDPPNS